MKKKIDRGNVHAANKNKALTRKGMRNQQDWETSERKIAQCKKAI